MNFYTKLTNMISKKGLANPKLALFWKEEKETEQELEIVKKI